jgi:hypothetical protein
MADLALDVDAALAEVPVNLLPLVASADGFTVATCTYNQAGLALYWNFITCAGAFTHTAVTPTDTAGNYDWISQGQGMFTIEIPASGGNTINNDTEGFGWFTGTATGICPWRGPVIELRAAGLNDKLTESAYDATRGLSGTALPAAAADAAGGLPISDAGGLDMDAILADTATIDTAGEIAAAVWNADATTYQTAGTFGQAIGDPGADANTIYKAVVTDATAATVGLDVVAIAADVDTIDTAGEIAAAVWGADATTYQAAGTFGLAIGDPTTDSAGGIYKGTVTDATGLNVAADVVALKAETVEILTDTAVIGALGAGLTALATAAELAKVPKSDSNVTWNATALGSIQTEANDALIANNLDHLALTATAAADMTIEVADNTILSRILGNGDTSTFVPSTDGLHALGADMDTSLLDTGTTMPNTLTAMAGAGFAATDSLVAIKAAILTVDDFVDTEVASILAAVDTEVADIKAKTDNLPQGIKRNTALAKFEFVMVDATTKAPATGLTVAGSRSIDGGAFAALTNTGTIAEVSSGIYWCDLAAADLNGVVITLRFTSAGADDCVVHIATSA